MDRATEKQLSLYLDGLLPEEERRAFEARLERDGELRRAVALHREAGAAMETQPELPEGFAARAGARLERRSADARTAWWHRFWSLETAGMLVSAGIIAMGLIPFLLKLEETGPAGSRPVVIGKAGTQENPRRPAPPPSGRMSPAEKKGGGTVSGQRQEATDLLKEMPEPSEQAASEPESPVSEQAPAAAAEPAGPPGLSVKIKSSELQDVAGADRTGPRSMVTAARAVSGFRSIPVAGTVPLNESGFIIIRTPSELAALQDGAAEKSDLLEQADRNRGAAPAGVLTGVSASDIDFGREMGILLPARLESPAPVRLEVTSVRSSPTGLEILYRETPLADDNHEPGSADRLQMIVVPATDQPVHLRRMD